MVRIITDSAADFEPWELEQLNITCIPLTVMFDEKEYLDGVDLTKDNFYTLLLNSQQLPKTAQASPQILTELFEDTHRRGDEAIYICLSSALSGTYQTALMTQSMLGFDSCFVTDSRNATGGQRMILEYAAKLRDEGRSAAQIVSALEEIRHRVVLFACIDTLEYLYKGGRISHTTYKVGTLANIKPIIKVNQEGQIEVPAKAMGMRKGIDYLCKRLEQFPVDDDFPFYVMYTNNIEVGRELAQKLASFGRNVPDDHIIQVGASIGSHIGPDACGLVYITK